MLVDELKRDNLINPVDYTVSVKNNLLYLNGVAQAQAINERYRKYFDNKGDFEVKNKEK